jgi:hypothetical protein
MTLIGANRDLRVDFFRGVALWLIFIDHIPGNWIAQFSLRNFALCDSTEVFVLLAGYAAGLAYGRSMDRHGWLFAGADVLRRAWVLYVAHIFLFVVFSAQVSYSATALDRSDYLEEIHIDALADAPYRAMLEALLLHFQPAYLDILPMYITLLALFALAMPLLRLPWLLLALSGLAYATARMTGYNFPSWTGGGWYFNPITWQFLFMIGAVLAYHPIRLPGPQRVYDILTGVILVGGVLLLWLVWPYADADLRISPVVARVLISVDKQNLHPMRLLSIFALVWLVVRTVPIGARWVRSWGAKPFVLCGQHSLPVFCAGIFLSFLGRLAMEERPDWTVQAAVNVLGAAALVGVGALAAWYRQKGVAARAALPVREHAGNPGTI